MVFYNSYHHAMDDDYAFHNIIKLGSPTSPFTAKQLAEFGARLNEGVKNVEVGALKEDVFDTIPKEHFDEIRRLAKLTNSNPSLHAPLLDPSGFGERGWSEQQRRANEEQLKSVIERAHQLDPTGNVPVDFHGANVFGVEWDKSLGFKDISVWDEKNKKYVEKKVEVPRTMVVVNQSTGEMAPLQYEDKKSFGGRSDPWDPYMKLDSLNQSTWDEEKLKILSQEKVMRELDFEEENLKRQFDPYQYAVDNKIELNPTQEARANSIQRSLKSVEGHKKEINRHVASTFKEVINKFNRFSNEKDPEYKIFMEGEGRKFKLIDEELKKIEEAQGKIRRKAESTGGRISQEDRETYGMLENQQKSNIIEMTSLIGDLPTPKIFKPVNEFAKEKASETIAEVAFHGFKKFGENAPVLAIENSYPNMPLSRADELKEALNIAKERFIKKAVEEEGVSEKEAKRIADKLIGATWDVAHINMMRRAGYTEEETKKLGVEEAKKIAPVLKHLHIVDNFGFSDTHLPPGMGNVPFKQILEALEKDLGEAEIRKIRGIVEAGAFAKEFETSPFPDVLKAFENPIYMMGAGPKQFYGTSMESYIEFPREHFNLYGSGFSTLPKELGGQVGGEKGRFMEGERE